MGLRTYKTKRDFRRTSEPKGGKPLPKGLPWVQGEKHLAVEVEDHPIEYENFEGVIPEGNYGGGTVMVWDRGTYYVYGEQPSKSLRDGKLHLVLDGKKAKGEWTLIRIRSDSQK